MDAQRAKRDAESQRYRLVIRLGLVQQKIRQDGLTNLKAKAAALRAQVEAVEVADDEVSARKARLRLAEFEPQVHALQQAAGVPEHGLPIFPRWVEFALWTAPVVLLFIVLAVVFGLRRRKVEVDQAGLDALDAAEHASARDD